MRQLMTSSTALTTTRHTHTARTFGRPRRVTVFTPPAPVNPAADLVAAVYGWGRVAVLVPNPDPCAAAWCVDCWAGSEETLDAGALLHHSAKAVIDAATYNGITSELPGEAAKRVIEVTVERLDETADPDRSEPAEVYLRLGDRGVDLPQGKAREVVAALRKAETGIGSLVERGGIDGTTGAVSIVRLGSISIQVGAVLAGDPGAQSGRVFVNLVENITAGDMRHLSRGSYVLYPPDSWDFTGDAAARLADAIAAAAVLVDADRASTGGAA